MKKKLLSLCLAAISTVVVGMNAFAADQSITGEGAATVSINANVASTFEVLCPVEVDIIQREVKTFTLNASGSISPLEYLSVDLPDTITMTTEGKDSVDLGVTCDNEELSDVELAVDGGTNIVCTIDATQITSGEWAGSLVIDIALKPVAP